MGLRGIWGVWGLNQKSRSLEIKSDTQFSYPRSVQLHAHSLVHKFFHKMRQNSETYILLAHSSLDKPLSYTPSPMLTLTA